MKKTVKGFEMDGVYYIVPKHSLDTIKEFDGKKYMYAPLEDWDAYAEGKKRCAEDRIWILVEEIEVEN